MKKTLILLMLVLIAPLMKAQSQPCLSDVILNSELERNPEAKRILDQFDQGVKERISKNLHYRSGGTSIITIPVVFYVVYDPAIPSSNIQDPQIDSQLDALNAYFLGTGIKFCKATKAGNQTINSITRFSNAALSAHDTATERTALINLIGNANISADRYLRIWIVNTIDGPTSLTQGYATLGPSAISNFDGIVIRNQVVGNEDDINCNCSLLYSKNKGKILAHEVGHYLGLYHTFQGGCSAPSNDCLLDGDKVCDTPKAAEPNYACIAGTNSCVDLPVNNPDDLSNYMDYGDDDCVNHFTTGQIERMRYMLDNGRRNLVSYDNMIYTATCGSANLISANFDASAFTVCSNNGTVNFSINSGANTSYSWDFGDPYWASVPGNPNTSNAQNPSHIYTNAAGSPYTVTLTVTNTVTLETATKTEKIYVTNCSTLGNENSYWYVGRSSGIQFSSGIPVFDPSFPSTNGPFGTSTVQNSSNGTLLFYANRYGIYDRLHNLLASNITFSVNTLGNSVLSVPDPLNNGDYYVFTNTNIGENPVVENGFRYYKVHVNGITASMVSTTRTAVTQPTGFGFPTSIVDSAIGAGGGIAAIKKCTGEYWILTTLQNSLVVYRLSSSGLTYVSQVSTPPVGQYLWWNIEVSPSGNKVFVYMRGGAYVGYNTLFDFNKADGTLSSSVSIFGNVVSGASFSPDSKLLYTAEQNTGIVNQYNLNALLVDGSRKQVGLGPLGQLLGDMQRGPDNKLYIGVTNYNELAVIHNPNTLADPANNITCNYSLHGPRKPFDTLNPSNTAGNILPNVIDAVQDTAYPSAINSISYYTTGCRGYKFFPDHCGTSFRWNFGDGTVVSTVTNPTHTFPAAGTYTVTLSDSGNNPLASVNVIVPGMATPTILGSSTICMSSSGPRATNNSVVLQPGQTVVWSIISGSGTISGPNNQSDVTINWNTPGTINLRVIESGCAIDVTRNITEEQPVATPISTDNFCFLTPDFSTAHTTTIPATYNALWTIDNGIMGTISTADNLATVGVDWPTGVAFGYLGLTLTSPKGCVSRAGKTVFDQCACDCLNSRTFSYTKSNLKVTFTVGNSNSNCIGAPGGIRFSWGDGTSSFSAIHTYAAAGTYTVTATPVIIGAYDEAICTGTAYTTNISVTCKNCLGGRQNFNNGIIISPNPASSMLNYTVNFKHDGNLETVIRSVDGKELLRKKWSLTEGQNDLQLELPSNISEGMIFVELISDEIKETKTIIIKK